MPWGPAYPTPPPGSGGWGPGYPGGSNPPDHGWIPQTSTAVPFSANGQLALATSQIQPVPATFSADGALAIQSMAKQFGNLNLSGNGQLSLVASAIEYLALNLSAGGVLALNARAQLTAALNMSADGQLSLFAAQYAQQFLNFTGDGQLAIAVSQIIQQALNFSSAGQLALLPMQIQFAPTLQSFTDLFNRANSATAIGNGWTPRANVLGINGNAAYPVTANVWDEASAPVVMGSNDMEVSITLGALTGSADYTVILLGMNAAGEGLFAFFNGGAGVTLYYQGKWDTTGLANYATANIASQTAGDVFTIRRIGNAYSVYQNGNLVLPWVDSGNIIPRDANHRIVGIAGYTDGTNYRAIDSFSAKDIGPFSSVGTLSISAFARFSKALALATAGQLAIAAAFPATAPAPQQFTAAGAYAYTIPYWCNKVDEILLGGAGGGKGLALFGSWGDGGTGGGWNVRTLVRGVDIPWTTAQITGTVGNGGTAGSNSGGNGGNGGTTTATATGMTSQTAAAGVGATTTLTNSAGLAPSPQSQTLNGQTYNGGATVAAGGGGKNGNPPGGGGSGSQVSSTAGGAGAPGSAWFYAYQ
jgi:hypothetical protein